MNAPTVELFGGVPTKTKEPGTITPEPWVTLLVRTSMSTVVLRLAKTLIFFAVGPDNAVTDKFALAVLLLVFGSGVVLDTVAVLFNAPKKVANTFAFIVNVAVVP